MIGTYVVAAEAELKRYQNEFFEVVNAVPLSPVTPEKILLTAPQSSRLSCHVFSEKTPNKPRTSQLKSQKLLGSNCELLPCFYSFLISILLGGYTEMCASPYTYRGYPQLQSILQCRQYLPRSAVVDSPHKICVLL